MSAGTLRHGDRPVEIALNALPQRIAGLGLAVHDECASGRLVKATEPRHEFRRVRMRGEVLDLLDRRPHDDVLAMHADIATARRQGSAARARRLETRQQDRTARIRSIRREVMHHTAAGCHTAAGQNDLRAVILVQPD